MMRGWDGSASRAKSSRVKRRQVKSSQVKRRQDKTSQVEPNQIKSSHVEPNQVEPNQVKSSLNQVASDRVESGAQSSGVTTRAESGTPSWGLALARHLALITAPPVPKLSK